MPREAVQCPICSNDFVASAIEAHVSKCLFLNESLKDENQPKRSNSAIQSKSKSPVVKRPKLFASATKACAGESSAVTQSQDSPPSKDPSTNEIVGAAGTRTPRNNHVPLAERMRPTSLITYIGQSHVMGKQSMLFQLLERGEIPNIILWGPPGCGKTSLANVIAHICKESVKLRYVKLSAAMSCVADVKEAVTIASNELKFSRRTVMFMDEIHRFNKAQQDVFLPHIESGTITLIGATTENPSFSLNSALLSRCRVIVLEKLNTADLIDILYRAVDSSKGLVHFSRAAKEDYSQWTSSCDDQNTPRFVIDAETVKWLAETCDGDARIALGGLELAVQSLVPSDNDIPSKGPGLIGLEDIRESLKKTHMLYDRKGDQHYDIISALHKCIRASDENSALYWLTRMMAGGEDPVYIARRLVRAASEDVGLEDPKALGIAVNTMLGCKMMGMPECDVLLAQCVTYLARAPKSRLMEDALRAAQRLVANHKGPQPGVPLHLRNAPTKMMRNLGYGRGYNMMHKDESGLSYLPEGMEHVDFFQTSDNNE